jgi:Rad52/22 family double-strand break repair protein
MSTKHPDLFAALAAPFGPHEVKVRSVAGRQLSYVTARTAMNRLDHVLGPENWWDEYFPNEHSVLCRLTIRMPDGSTLTKSDAGGYAGMADSGDDDKSGYSDAFKRAAVKFGVARYLYRDGVPAFAAGGKMTDVGAMPGRDDAVQRSGHAAEPPPTTPPAPPGPHRSRASAHPRSDPKPGQKQTESPGAPRTGKALFAWTLAQEQRHEVGLLRHLNQWAKPQDFPGRMVDWDARQVKLAHDEARRWLAALKQGEETYGHMEAIAN